MPRPTATIENQINAPIGNVFRRAFIKRRSSSTGLYEPTWFNISEFVKSWGTIKLSVDELRLNKFRHSGITLKVRNDGGDFNPNSNDQSLWNGFMTRYRTLLKIEAGYSTWDNTELPTDPTLGIFILTNDVDISGVTNDAKLKFNSLQTVFEQVKARDVAGLGGAQTASDLIARFRDASDGAGSAIFTQFITASAWLIQTTTASYNLATSTTIEEMNCWEVMSKLAEAEGFLLLINRTGGFEFRDRNERTSTSQFAFKGQGFADSNIIKLKNYLEPVTKLFNNFRLQYLRDDTSTSFLTAGTTTSVNPSQSTWQFGVHLYEFKNLWFPNTASAQAAIDTLVTQFDVIKEEVKIQCKFIPQLEVSDKVQLNYHSYDIIGESRWGLFDWASDAASLTEDAEWAGQIGENFDWTDENFKILSKTINLDKFTTDFHLRHL